MTAPRIGSFQSGLCRNRRVSRAEANANGVSIFNDCQHGRSPGSDFPRYPSAEIVSEQRLVLDDDHVTGFNKRRRKYEGRPV
jgi:hypothetical protein